MFAKHKYILLAFLIVILMRVPALIMWSPNITGSDSAIYMETARNIAEGKGYVSSICRYDMNIDKLRDYVNEHGNRYQGWSRAPIYTYMMSGIYLITGKEHYMTGVNILNLLLFILSLVIIYRFMLQRYPDKKYAHYIAILWIGGSYVIFVTVFSGWLENFALLNFLLAYILHISITSRNDCPLWKIILYSFVLASLFTIKRSTMVISVPFIMHLFLLRNWKLFFRVISIFICFAGGWYIIRNLFMSTPPFDLLSSSFPFSGEAHATNYLHLFNTSPSRFFINVMGLLRELASPSVLGLLFICLVIYLIKSPNKTEKQVIWIILISQILLIGVMNYPVKIRHIIPICIPLIISSSLVFDTMLNKLKKDLRLIVLYVFIAPVVYWQIIQVTDFTKRVYYHAADRDLIFEAADTILNDNQVPEDAVILSNIIGYNLYSDRGYVLAPLNINSLNYHEIIDFYGVDYVLHSVGYTQYLGWTEYTLMTDIYQDLPLVEASKMHTPMKLYSTKRTKQLRK